MISYISNIAHYERIVRKSLDVKTHLWIGTADIKDLYVKDGLQGSTPYLSALNRLLQGKVEVKILCAKTPGENFQRDLQKFPLLYKHLELVKCPRVHFKLFIFDLNEVYIGSANLTGAGIGMKSKNKRNFEAGILTDEAVLVEQAINQFDEVWNGSMCTACQRKEFCEMPISNM